MQAHKKIELFEYDKQAISQSYADLYKKGMSLTDIAKQTGKAKSAVHANLVKAGIELRKFKNVAITAKKSQKAKTNIQPPYGFCYFRGQIVPDQKEYENLMMSTSSV